MTVLFGDFEDFSHLDLHLLAAADAHERAQIRLDRARISARTQGTLPDQQPDDIAAARSGSWRALRRDELGDEQPERLGGGRLYLLAFEGIVRYIKVGMVEGRTMAALRVHQEYFYGIPFGLAMTAIELERPEVEGTPRHPGVVYQE
ncbi:hypothetical protein [Streptomyces cucumeris]|uniref:hypothetical protein n=1 Tax=Streptomyces cucumeris TaxID=2962890 RepID=UPI0020C884AE|nr:hypothetical protein [Streptomyces sp. NEAU-Y11]MCP9211446.1 hypothetical protein [Streptomyces sp. NEAU-Y11]